MVLGTFLPFLLLNFADRAPRNENLATLLLGTIIWFTLFTLVAAITGWRVNERRSTGKRVAFTLLFTVVACAAGLGVGFAECSAAKRIWPDFPM
jgi:glycerol uptake facilitator-like aquaporin